MFPVGSPYPTLTVGARQGTSERPARYFASKTTPILPLAKAEEKHSATEATKHGDLAISARLSLKDFTLLGVRIDTSIDTLAKVTATTIHTHAKETATAIASLGERVDTRIDTLTERIDTRIDSLAKETATAIANLGGRIDTRIDTLAKETSTAIANLGERMDTRIDTLTERMDTRFDTLTERIDTRIDTLTERIRTFGSNAEKWTTLLMSVLVAVLSAQVALFVMIYQEQNSRDGKLIAAVQAATHAKATP